MKRKVTKILAVLLAVTVLCALAPRFVFSANAENVELQQLLALADFMKNSKFDHPSDIIAEAAVQAVHEKFGYEIVDKLFYTSEGELYRDLESFPYGKFPRLAVHACFAVVTKEQIKEALQAKYPMMTDELFEDLFQPPDRPYLPSWPDLSSPSWYSKIQPGYIVRVMNENIDERVEYVDYTSKNDVYSFYYQYKYIERDGENETESCCYYEVVLRKRNDGGVILEKYGTVEVLPNFEKTNDQLTEVTFKAEKGITIADSNAFAAGTVVTAVRLKEGDLYQKASAAMKDISGKYEVFEFNAALNGAAVQPSGKVSVTFEIPEDFSADNLKMYYIQDGKAAEEIKISVDSAKKTVTAELEHFSTYVLANVNTVKSPYTGQRGRDYVFFLGLVLAAGAAVLMKQKRNA